MNRFEQEFTSKEVCILVLAVVGGIAFAETSSPVISLAFWREFLVKFLSYCVISAVMMIVVSMFNGKHR